MPAETVHADMAAIRALGDALTAHAADLGAAVAILRSMPSPAAALGPVGERFVSALAEAVSRHSDAIADLSARTGAGATRAGHTAAGYDAAGRRAAQLLPQV